MISRFGGEGNDMGYDIIETPDGRFAICGVTSSEFEKRDILMVKTDSDGNLEWSKVFGERGEE